MDIWIGSILNDISNTWKPLEALCLFKKNLFLLNFEHVWVKYWDAFKKMFPLRIEVWTEMPIDFVQKMHVLQPMALDLKWAVGDFVWVPAKLKKWSNIPLVP